MKRAVSELCWENLIFCLKFKFLECYDNIMQANTVTKNKQ